MIRLRGLLLGLLQARLLGACATTGPGEPSTPGWQAHSAQLRALQQWRASGKLALRSPTQSETAILDWQQDGDTTRVQLRGPLGMGAIQIHSDGRQLEILRDGDVRIVDISSRDEVLRHTGWDLPVGALPHWLKGLPDPVLELQSLQLDPDSELPRTLSQGDWDVSYEAFENTDGLSLPTRLRLENGDTRATVIIRTWRIEPQTLVPQSLDPQTLDPQTSGAQT